MHSTAIESEKAVIGLLINHPELYYEIDRLNAEHFQNKSLADLYGALGQAVVRKQMPTISWLAANTKVAEPHIAKLEKLKVDPGQAGLYEDQIILAWKHRVTESIVQTMPDGADPVLYLANALKKVGVEGGSDAHISKVVEQYHKNVEIARKIPLEHRTLQTPWVDINQRGGLYLSNLSFLAAPPGMGKTSFMTQLREHILDMGFTAISFLLEMSEERLLERIIAQKIGKPLRYILRKEFLEEPDDAAYLQILQITNRISKWDWHLYGSKCRNGDLLIKTLESHLANNPKVRFGDIDFAQLMYLEGSSLSRNYELERIVNQLGGITTTNYHDTAQFHLMVAAQLKAKEIAKRQDKRPELTDLKDAGAFEQDADLVVAIHRDDYWNKDSEPTNMAELWYLKDRNGPANTHIDLYWDGTSMTFKNAAKVDTESEPWDVW